MIIDGTCTVDNNVGTDNVAYGTLTIGTAIGRTLNWVVSGTNRLNVSNVSAGTVASVLDMTNGGRQVIDGQVHATADRVRQHRTRAAIGHMDQVDPCCTLQEFTGEMQARAVAGTAVSKAT